jgi:hypothetical protein
MQRFNVFLLIHKGLRAYMYDVSAGLQHTDFANATGFPHSLEKLGQLLEVFDKHAHHEDNYIFSMLANCNPQLREEMEQEHVTDHALSTALRDLMAAYATATDSKEKGAIGSRICYTYNDFIAFNLTHLNKEEIVVNESLWKHYTDADILEANMRMLSTLSAEDMKTSAVWMMRGCNNTEINGWLSNVKRQAPPAVLAMLLGIAEQELPAQRFEAIQSSVMEAV